MLLFFQGKFLKYNYFIHVSREYYNFIQMDIAACMRMIILSVSIILDIETMSKLILYEI